MPLAKPLCAPIPDAHQTSPYGVDSNWIKRSQPEELQQLAKLEARIRLKEKALAELKSQRNKIMRRCIRRERRASGKE